MSNIVLGGTVKLPSPFGKMRVVVERADGSVEEAYSGRNMITDATVRNAFVRPTADDGYTVYTNKNITITDSLTPMSRSLVAIGDVGGNQLSEAGDEIAREVEEIGGNTYIAITRRANMYDALVGGTPYTLRSVLLGERSGLDKKIMAGHTLDTPIELNDMDTVIIEHTMYWPVQNYYDANRVEVGSGTLQAQITDIDGITTPGSTHDYTVIFYGRSFFDWRDSSIGFPTSSILSDRSETPASLGADSYLAPLSEESIANAIGFDTADTSNPKTLLTITNTRTDYLTADTGRWDVEIKITFPRYGDQDSSHDIGFILGSPAFHGKALGDPGVGALGVLLDPVITRSWTEALNITVNLRFEYTYDV